ncbi:MAG: hypothetical protein E4H20_10395, partial [Spirochaetales bacterium]
MIGLHSQDDGFYLTLRDRRLLDHSRKHPLLILGVAERRIVGHRNLPRIRSRLSSSKRTSAWKATETRHDFVEIEFDGLLRMAVQERDGIAHITFSCFDSSVNWLRIRLPGIPGETVFGGGERFAGRNLKGSRIVLDSRAAVGGLRPTDPSLPSDATALIDGRRIMRIVTGAPVILDCRSQHKLTVDCWSVPDELCLGLCTSVSDAAAGLNRAAGSSERSRSYPAWPLEGISLSVRGGVEEISRRVHSALEAGIHLGSILLRDWQGSQEGRNPASYGWIPDPRLYPALEDEAARFKHAGIRVLVTLAPRLSRDSALFSEASERGFLVKRSDGSDYLLGSTRSDALPDLWNPNAFMWIKDRIKTEILGRGLSGWVGDSWIDPPPDAVLYGDSDAVQHGNEFAGLWGRAGEDAIREAGAEGSIAIYPRPAWGRLSPMVSGTWSPWGSDRGRRPGCLTRGLFLGLTGNGPWHPEIRASGLAGDTGRDAFMRRVEAAAISPLMRILDDEPYWTDLGLMSHLARMSRMWTLLAPYHGSVAVEFA